MFLIVKTGKLKFSMINVINPFLIYTKNINVKIDDTY